MPHVYVCTVRVCAACLCLPCACARCVFAVTESSAFVSARRVCAARVPPLRGAVCDMELLEVKRLRLSPREILQEAGNGDSRIGTHSSGELAPSVPLCWGEVARAVVAELGSPALPGVHCAGGGGRYGGEGLRAPQTDACSSTRGTNVDAVVWYQSGKGSFLSLDPALP